MGGSEAIFDWFRYVQDFPGEFAVSWLERLAPAGAGSAPVVWEPFAGSGTTLLAAQLLGHRAWGCDTNPFMVEVAATKADWGLDVDTLRSAGGACADRYAGADLPAEPPAATTCPWPAYADATAGVDADYPADPKLRRWISPLVLNRFLALVAAIDAEPDPRVRRFLRLAAASQVIGASNVRFRPNVCYRAAAQLDVPVGDGFARRVEAMVADYSAVAGRPHVPATVVLGDSRDDGPVGADVVFTSPPYPNDMEYVHQTRLELALLGHVVGTGDLTAIKKRMISSSVKLVYRENEWQKAFGLAVPGVAAVYSPIAASLEGRGWGWNAADMVAQYFGGIRAVLRNWHARLAEGGVAAVVVGDSAFNGVPVATDVLTAEVAAVEGFGLEGIEVFRSRWNTKHDVELRESVVVLRRLRTRR